MTKIETIYHDVSQDGSDSFEVKQKWRDIDSFFTSRLTHEEYEEIDNLTTECAELHKRYGFEMGFKYATQLWKEVG